MPRNKRSAEEKLQYYRNKIRRYEEQALNQEDSAEIEACASSSNWHSSEDDEEPIVFEVVDPEQNVDQEESAPTEQLPATEPSTAEPEAVAIEVPELDPELLKALGEATDSLPEFGEKIHDSLSKLWTPLLKKGLSKDNKEKLLKEYLVPENCKMLQAPKINPEITAAVSDLARNRDKKMMNTQQQLGMGITALNRALTTLLTTDNKILAIKQLSDSCRILCDLHYLDSQNRTKVITPGLDKSFCQLIQDVERDETLFGNKLSEKIKASKVIEKQGLQIKKPANNPKPSTNQLATSRPINTQGNWSGPSRSSNRGGRGGSRRPQATGQHSRTPFAPQQQQQQQQQRQQNTNKPRAPPAQHR